MKRKLKQQFIKINQLILLCWFLVVPLFIFAQQSENQEYNFNSEIEEVNLPFILNSGQMDSEVEFYANTFSGTVFITKDGSIVYSLPKYNEETTQVFILNEEFVGGEVNMISGENPAKATVNYFRGNDKSKWKSNISTYNIVDLGEVYNGIDIKLKAYSNNIEKLFFVKPGTKPESIKVKLSDINSLVINKTGQMEAETELGTITFTKPIAYQEINGNKEYVDVEYTVNGNEYGFVVGNYNTENELIIDPLLASTFLGGNDVDDNYEPGMAIDSNGNVFITGRTFSADFPNVNSYDDELSGSSDRFISKFSNDLSTLIASTFLGGSSDELGMGIYFDSNDNVYLSGYTFSQDFPCSANAYNSSNNGMMDAFVTKLDNDLANLLASTYIGGSNDEGYRWPRIDIAVGESGNVYVMGLTKSYNFPYNSGAVYDSTYATGGSFNGGDAFIVKFDTDLSALLGSTYLGGGGDEWRISIVLDDEENVYVCGQTQGQGFPTTPGAYDETYNSSPDYGDIFISKFTGDLLDLSASTYLGTSYEDESLALRLDSENNIFMVGYSTSSESENFTTSDAYDTTWNGGYRDVLVAKFNNDLSEIMAATLVGGTGEDTGEDIIIDDNDDIFIVGKTKSVNFPCLPFSYDTTRNGNYDIFISKLNNNLTTLSSSTYLGTNGVDWGQCIRLDNDGNVFVTGRTSSNAFPFTPEAYDTIYNGGDFDCYIAKFNNMLSFHENPHIPRTNFAASPKNVEVNETVTFTDYSYGLNDTYEWNFGEGATPATANTAGPHEVTYSTAGEKTVSLYVSNSFGNETETKIEYISVSPGSSINEIKNIRNIQVFPNPNNGIFEIELIAKERTDALVNIYDNLGRKIYTREFSNINQKFNTKIDLSNLLPGVYNIEVITTNDVIYKRIITK